MAAPLDPAQVSGRSPRLPLSDPQRRGPAARTCGRTVTFDPSPSLLPAVSRSARMGSPRLRVRNPGVSDLPGCGHDLFPGGVGAAGPDPVDPVPGGDAADVWARGVPICHRGQAGPAWSCHVSHSSGAGAWAMGRSETGIRFPNLS
ncbi:uncharacterized protein [Manis javanica]|uniref:uncharacterized protein isoform X1 n=1 Tax=Manis javanica TaxID=9974 RepID=UPI003C6D5A4F